MFNAPATPLVEAQQAGFLLSKIPFLKKALTLTEQIEMLEKRGMIISDRDRAEHYLRFIGYYRLSGYWYPFHAYEEGVRTDNFVAGTTFETVLERYVFDRELRVLLMDAIERIEVAAKSAITNALSERAGPHWYLNAANFTPTRKNGAPFDHADYLKRIFKDAHIFPEDRKKQQGFITSYIDKYDPPAMPACWMMMEICSLGAVSNTFSCLLLDDQKSTAQQFGMPHERVASWLHACNYSRNLAAHHFRIWNRIFRVKPTVVKSMKKSVVAADRFYNHAVMLQMFLKVVSEGSTWGQRLKKLIEDHPNIPLAEMGFPPDWHEAPAWQ